MSLFWHIFIHIALSLLAGLIIFLVWRKFWLAIIPTLISGVAVDFDHLIDYLLAFGWHFRLDYFERGYQFLKSDKIYILFHAWEYVIIFVVLAVIFRNNLTKTIFFSLALGLFFHLGADCLLNEGMRPQAYSIVYRIENNFNTERLVAPEHWQKQIEQKKMVKFE